MKKNLKNFLKKIFAFAVFSVAEIVPAFAENAEIPAEKTTENSLAERVIVVANSNDPASVELAKYYLVARKIPAENLVVLPMPTAETVSWSDFSEKVFSPLRKEFVARGWIDGVVLDTLPPDDFGRIRLGFPQNFDPEKSKNADKIFCVVLCRGVPLRIANAPEKLPPLPEGRSRDPLGTNCASVDSEIALLGVPDTDPNGAIISPFFKDHLGKNIPGAKLFLRVARLDGKTLNDAKSLVASAITAERTGLLGRAYIDIGGPHAEGDKWLEICAEKTQALGFETSVDRTKSLMPATSRYDAPALYFGWYSQNVGGFFLDPNFRFPAGAIAIHIHSFSATSMRSNTAWTPSLVARGVAATVGNVYEPYLGMTHYPHLFLEALAEGKTAGEAAAFALPVLSWQGVFVGDPLYRPFLKSPEDSMEPAFAGDASKFSQYAFLRAANLAEFSGDKKRAEQILKNGKMFAPGLALNFYLAQKEAEATGMCSRIHVSVPTEENPGLLLETARLMAKSTQAAAALDFYSYLLDQKIAPDFVREKILLEACDLARSRGDSKRLATWYAELEDLKKLKNAKK